MEKNNKPISGFAILLFTVLAAFRTGSLFLCQCLPKEDSTLDAILGGSLHVADLFFLLKGNHDRKSQPGHAC